MKIAVISTKQAELNSGAEVRNYYLFHELKRNFNAKFYSPELPKFSSTISRLLSILRGKVPYIEYFRNASFDKKNIEEIRQADILHIEELESYFVIEKYLSDFSGTIVLDAHNIEYLKFQSDLRSQNFINKYFGEILSYRVKKLEIEVLQKIDYLIVCSQVDKKYFSQYIPSEKILYIPNGVDCNYITSKKLKSDSNILFMGLLSYGPNEDGIRYYLHEIHPLVREKIDGVIITIIGKNPPEWLKKLAKEDSSIILNGFVKDIRTELYNARVCICPLRSGSGTRLKVLEYMAAARPVVSTSKGAEGINAKDSEHILIANTSKDFADKIFLLLSDNKEAQHMSENARKFVVENYNWKNITSTLNSFYKKFSNHNI